MKTKSHVPTLGMVAKQLFCAAPTKNEQNQEILQALNMRTAVKGFPSGMGDNSEHLGKWNQRLNLRNPSPWILSIHVDPA